MMHVGGAILCGRGTKIIITQVPHCSSMAEEGERGRGGEEVVETGERKEVDRRKGMGAGSIISIPHQITLCALYCLQAQCVWF